MQFGSGKNFGYRKFWKPEARQNLNENKQAESGGRVRNALHS